jgi:hypothetical protein
VRDPDDDGDKHENNCRHINQGWEEYGEIGHVPVSPEKERAGDREMEALTA